MRMLSTLFVLAGCAVSSPEDTSDAVGGTSTTVTTDCAYPEGAVEPMAEGEVLYPYFWPDARHRSTGAEGNLQLEDVPCNTDPDIDWSPFDVLLFISLPAW
jgi:hypothetical protein